MKLRRLATDSVLGVLVTLVLLALFEVIFWAAGMGEPQSKTSLSRGFSQDEEYLVPDPDVAGGWRTQMFDGEYKERAIPPKSRRKRVILFGGSNTRGFQRGMLPEHFAEVANRSAYEVINLGRSGYGSGRVAVLFAQAVELLEPDIVVIYCGHNELTEASFEMDIEGRWSSDWVRNLAEVGRKTRTVNVLAEAFAPEESTRSTKPKAWASEYLKFINITYDQTQLFFASYEQNLRSMCATALDRGVGVVLSTVIHNRFAAPFGSAFPATMSAQDRAEFRRIHKRAVEEYPPFLATILPERELDRIHQFDWVRKGVDAVLGAEEVAMDAELPGLRPSLGPLADQDPLLGDPSTWHPKIRKFYGALEELYASRGDPALERQLTRAKAFLRNALKLCPDHPRALFELALVGYLLADDDELVRRHFEQAAEFDRAPRKGNEATNSIVRRVAADYPEVFLFDADAIFAARVPMGLFGWEWATDHCHLNIGARRVLMRDLAEAIVGRWGS